MKPSVFVVGYQPRPGVPLEDYTDFQVGTSFSLEDIDHMTEMGVLPPGIILMGKQQGKLSKPCVVRGHYGQIQTLEVMTV